MAIHICSGGGQGLLALQLTLAAVCVICVNLWRNPLRLTRHTVPRLQEGRAFLVPSRLCVERVLMKSQAAAVRVVRVVRGTRTFGQGLLSPASGGIKGQEAAEAAPALKGQLQNPVQKPS
jgi:hypothetical protein